MPKLDWKGLYPDLRVALGLIGKAGYPPGQAAAVVIEHKAFNAIRRDYERLTGRPLTASILASRIYHHSEIESLRKTNGRAYKIGETLSTELIQMLDKAGVPQ